ncbi:hypothetical protein [Gimesia sp.]|uniref:hypothetical protein n=1 Tax=Gimesia sp. TaxID=2024833 RepID=UPI003A9245FE
MVRERTLWLVDRMRTAMDHCEDYSEYLKELEEISPNVGVYNMCKSDYPDEMLAEIIEGYEQYARTLSREELISLVREFQNGDTTEGKDSLIVYAVDYNSLRPDGSDILICPEDYFEDNESPSPEMIIDLLLDNSKKTNKVPEVKEVPIDMDRDHLLWMLKRLKSLKGHSEEYGEYLKEFGSLCPYPIVHRLCIKDYPDEIIAEIIEGYFKFDKALSREELVFLVKEYQNGPKTEGRSFLIITAISHNSMHTDGTRLLLHPEDYFDSNESPSPEMIVDLLLDNSKKY